MLLCCITHEETQPAASVPGALTAGPARYVHGCCCSMCNVYSEFYKTPDGLSQSGSGKPKFCCVAGVSLLLQYTTKEWIFLQGLIDGGSNEKRPSRLYQDTALISEYFLIPSRHMVLCRPPKGFRRPVRSSWALFQREIRSVAYRLLLCDSEISHTGRSRVI